MNTYTSYLIKKRAMEKIAGASYKEVVDRLIGNLHFGNAMNLASSGIKPGLKGIGIGGLVGAGIGGVKGLMDTYDEDNPENGFLDYTKNSLTGALKWGIGGGLAGGTIGAGVGIGKGIPDTYKNYTDINSLRNKAESLANDITVSKDRLKELLTKYDPEEMMNHGKFKYNQIVDSIKSLNNELSDISPLQNIMEKGHQMYEDAKPVIQNATNDLKSKAQNIVEEVKPIVLGTADDLKSEYQDIIDKGKDIPFVKDILDKTQQILDAANPQAEGNLIDNLKNSDLYNKTTDSFNKIKDFISF
jgi:FtsZ-binding cell division protein ZapB